MPDDCLPSEGPQCPVSCESSKWLQNSLWWRAPLEWAGSPSHSLWKMITIVSDHAPTSDGVTLTALLADRRRVGGRAGEIYPNILPSDARIPSFTIISSIVR